MVVVGAAAAIFTASGATAAWALSSEDEAPVEQTVAAEQAEGGAADDTAKSDQGAVEEAPADEAEQAEEPAEEAADEPADEEEPAEPKGPVVPDAVDGLDDEQMGNAVTIIEAGKDEGFDRDGWAVALATAMQEAKLYNAASDDVPESADFTDSEVVYTDHDSVGIFQQRTSMGWGSIEELMDVSTSAGKFYGTLNGISGWQDMSIAEAAQAVQISAFPDHYAQWEDLSWDIIDAYEDAN